MIIRADARALPLIDGCVDCVVTSPPYFGLRDYGHVHQIGLEASPAEYVAALVLVFREVRRVLTDSGTLWLNIGDSYATVGGQSTPQMGAEFADRARGSSVICRSKRMGRGAGRWGGGNAQACDEIKPKDLVGIPWMVAFALRADGWYLRSDIIWSKPNPMPESTKDRPTKAHEYMFLLAKSERYYYDCDAIKEPYAESTLREIEDGYDGEATKDYAGAGVQNPSDTKRRIIEGARKRKNDKHVDRRKHGVNEWDKRKGLQPAGPQPLQTIGKTDGRHDAFSSGVGRNKRSVWTVPTMPYSGAHFATFPEKLVEPCILAGCPEGGIILDPFLGSGTVGAVASRLGRRWVGTDLSYQSLAKKRTAQRGLMFTQESA